MRQIEVAPFTGAWIEIGFPGVVIEEIKSHPSRVRGLKYVRPRPEIEPLCRTLHGCVD